MRHVQEQHNSNNKGIIEKYTNDILSRSNPQRTGHKVHSVILHCIIWAQEPFFRLLIIGCLCMHNDYTERFYEVLVISYSYMLLFHFLIRFYYLSFLYECWKVHQFIKFCVFFTIFKPHFIPIVRVSCGSKYPYLSDT